MSAQRRLSGRGGGKIAGRVNSSALIEPFRVGDFVVRGSETSVTPEDIFRRGWATLGFIEPARPMSWGEFREKLHEELYFAEENILERAFDIMKRKLERLGYEVERSRRMLFLADGDEPRVWYIVKKRGRPVAYCDLTISEGEEEEDREPYAELLTVCVVPEH
jgi:hypothetical protein